MKEDRVSWWNFTLHLLSLSGCMFQDLNLFPQLFLDIVLFTAFKVRNFFRKELKCPGENTVDFADWVTIFVGL